jgi:hypothetical protein
VIVWLCPLDVSTYAALGRDVPAPRPACPPFCIHVGGGELDLLDRAPALAAVDQFGLVQAVDRFGEGVVEALTG